MQQSVLSGQARREVLPGCSPHLEAVSSPEYPLAGGVVALQNLTEQDCGALHCE